MLIPRLLSRTVSNAPLVKSSCPAGTVMKGLNIMKDGTDPIAMNDEEYPSWLWELKARKKREWITEEDKLSLGYLRSESREKIKNNTMLRKTK